MAKSRNPRAISWLPQAGDHTASMTDSQLCVRCGKHTANCYVPGEGWVGRCCASHDDDGGHGCGGARLDDAEDTPPPWWGGSPPDRLGCL